MPPSLKMGNAMMPMRQTASKGKDAIQKSNRHVNEKAIEAPAMLRHDDNNNNDAMSNRRRRYQRRYAARREKGAG